MDLILGYPEKNTAFIGLFMTDVRYQHRGMGSQIVSGLAAYLSACGCEKIRLGVDKGNPQSHAFWTKNRFQTIGEAGTLSWSGRYDAPGGRAGNRRRKDAAENHRRSGAGREKLMDVYAESNLENTDFSARRSRTRRQPSAWWSPDFWTF